MKKVTIYDIAKEAGVSPKTVSKVLNCKGGVNEDTRKKVLEIIEKLGYRPNIFARSLRVNRPACVGVTFPAPVEVTPFSQNFFLWLFSQLYKLFGRNGEYICFDMAPYEGDKSGNYARGVFNGLFNSCIVAGPISINDTTVFRIHEVGIPYITFGRLPHFPELSSAAVDYEEAAYISTKFLIERGHKKIALLQGFPNYQPGHERIRGYQRALEEAGLVFDMNLIRPVNFAVRNIANKIQHLLSDKEVTALIDSSGMENGEALRTGIRYAGREIVKDCEVVTWTYEAQGVVMREASAHVWLPVRESASEGMEWLARWLKGEVQGPAKIIFRPVLDIHRKGDKEIEADFRFFDNIKD